MEKMLESLNGYGIQELLPKDNYIVFIMTFSEGEMGGHERVLVSKCSLT
jgi:hypothetical protein